MILYRKDIVGHLPGEFHKDTNWEWHKLQSAKAQTPQDAYNYFDEALEGYLNDCTLNENGDTPEGWKIEWKTLPELKNTESGFMVEAELVCYRITNG